jgi:hypothetical protein
MLRRLGAASALAPVLRRTDRFAFFCVLLAIPPLNRKFRLLSHPLRI